MKIKKQLKPPPRYPSVWSLLLHHPSIHPSIHCQISTLIFTHRGKEVMGRIEKTFARHNNPCLLNETRVGRHEFHGRSFKGMWWGIWDGTPWCFNEKKSMIAMGRFLLCVDFWEFSLANVTLSWLWNLPSKHVTFYHLCKKSTPNLSSKLRHAIEDKCPLSWHFVGAVIIIVMFVERSTTIIIPFTIINTIFYDNHQ